MTTKSDLSKYRQIQKPTLKLKSVHIMFCFRKICWFIFPAILLSACVNLPQETLLQNDVSIKKKITEDNVELLLDNTVKCPVRFFATSKNENIQEKLNKYFPHTLAPLEKKTIQFKMDTSNVSGEKILSSIKTWAVIGDPQRDISKNKISLPYPENWWFNILQGYHGKFSHQSDYSRYALDFSMRVGDTVSAADDGLVVGVIKDYNVGGGHRRYRDFANYITVYHPHSGLFTQYVHLMHQGIFVEVGDSVKQGQPIGQSGMTGFTSTSHLHFNVLVPSEEGMVSVPIEFIEGYRGEDLKEKMKVIKHSQVK